MWHTPRIGRSPSAFTAASSGYRLRLIGCELAGGCRGVVQPASVHVNHATAAPGICSSGRAARHPHVELDEYLSAHDTWHGRPESSVRQRPPDAHARPVVPAHPMDRGVGTDTVAPGVPHACGQQIALGTASVRIAGLQLLMLMLLTLFSIDIEQSLLSMFRLCHAIRSMKVPHLAEHCKMTRIQPLAFIFCVLYTFHGFTMDLFCVLVPKKNENLVFVERRPRMSSRSVGSVPTVQRVCVSVYIGACQG